MQEQGQFYKKPVLEVIYNCSYKDDAIQWLMDSAKGIEARTEYLTSRILMLNFGSMHTTSMVSIGLFFTD